MKIPSKFVVFVLVVSFVLASNGTALAATTINLGTAGNFAVLGGSTITNTGSTVVNGDLGLSPGTSVTGFPPGTVNGNQHVTDAAAAQGQSDLVSAYNTASAQTGAVTISGDLGGQTLAPGVYNSASSLSLTGTLTLDGQNNPNSVFIFQVGSALTTSSGSRINLINGAQACNVFWQVASSATLGTNSTFSGTLLVFTSITATTGAIINGRVLTRNGAVTLDTSSVNRPTCTVVAVTPTPTPTSTPVVIIPAPIVTPTPVTITPTPIAITVPVVAPTVASIPAPTTTLSMPAPGLPKTGIDPNSPQLPWQLPIFILSGLAAAAIYFKRKQIFPTSKL